MIHTLLANTFIKNGRAFLGNRLLRTARRLDALVLGALSTPRCGVSPATGDMTYIGICQTAGSTHFSEVIPSRTHLFEKGCLARAIRFSYTFLYSVSGLR